MVHFLLAAMVGESNYESTTEGCYGRGAQRRVAQRQGRWKSDAYKVYTVNNIEDSRRVSRILGDKRRTVSRQPGDGDVWGVTREVANSNAVKTPRPRYG